MKEVKEVKENENPLRPRLEVDSRKGFSRKYSMRGWRVRRKMQRYAKLLYTVNDLHHMLSISTSEIRNDIRKGRLHCHLKRGTTRPYLIDRKELERYYIEELPEVE